MTDDIRQRAIALYDRFTHEGMERREFITGWSRWSEASAPPKR